MTNSIDRLAELKILSGKNDKKRSSSLLSNDTRKSSTTLSYLTPYDTIKHEMDIITSAIDEIYRLKKINKKCAIEKERKEIMSQVNRLMTDTTQHATRIKHMFSEINMENEKMKVNKKNVCTKTATATATATVTTKTETTKKQGYRLIYQVIHSYSPMFDQTGNLHVRENLYQTHIRKFQTIMTAYNTATHEFQNDLKIRTTREIGIVAPHLSPSEVETIVESGQAQDLIKRAIISDQLQDTVRVIEERHVDILKLEQQILEIYQLFRDLSTLVDLQQESLDVIEVNIQKAQQHTQGAEVKLQDAEKYQKKARNRGCCLLGLLMGCLVAILAPVILRVTGKI